MDDRPAQLTRYEAARFALAEADDLETYWRRKFGANDNAGAR
jgi:hypothetical protein